MSNSPSNFFTTPLLNGLLAQVVQLVRFGDGLPIIYGEQGIGKSAVALEVSNRLASDGVVVCVDCREFITDFTVFLTFALSELGYASDDVTSAGEGLSQLRNFSRLLLKSQRLAVLVLDNAGVLDDMSLAALLSLAQGQGDNGVGLRFVFTGSVDLVDRIDKLDIVDVGVYDFELSSLSPIEAEDFIAFVADERGVSLSKESAASLWSASKGNPSKILGLIEQTPLSVAAESTNVFSPSMPDLKKIPIWHAATVVVLLIALIWVYSSRDHGAPKTVAVEIIDLPQSMAQTREKKAAVTSAPIVQDSLVGEGRLDSMVSGVADVALPERASLPKELPVQNQQTDVVPLVDEPQKISALNEKAIDTSEPVVVTQIAKPPLDKVPNVAPQSELSRLLQQSRSYISKQSPSHYALQVLALSNETALLQYVRRQPNKNVLRVINVRRGDTELFIVITGAYASKEAAQKAISGLPLVQRQAKPWPKTYGSIQADMQ